MGTTCTRCDPLKGAPRRHVCFLIFGAVVENFSTFGSKKVIIDTIAFNVITTKQHC